MQYDQLELHYVERESVGNRLEIHCTFKKIRLWRRMAQGYSQDPFFGSLSVMFWGFLPPLTEYLSREENVSCFLLACVNCLKCYFITN